jgi:hypothetical protein
MKRGAPDNPKLKRLAAILQRPRYQIVGIMESIWHFCAYYAKRGDIGKWSNAEIAAAIEWDGDAEMLVNALIDTRLLDENNEFRLLVHDWHEHADQTIQRSEEVKKLGFASGQLGNASQPSLALPSLAISNDHFDAWWKFYPKRVGKAKAAESYEKAIHGLVKSGLSVESAAAKLLAGARRYAAARKDEDPKFTAHPTTWLNQGRWDDEMETRRNGEPPQRMLT